MITEIGITAGEIWHYLDENKCATLDQLAKEINRPQELILMSLGWLAREGHVTVGGAEDGFKASLVEKKKE